MEKVSTFVWGTRFINQIVATRVKGDYARSWNCWSSLTTSRLECHRRPLALPCRVAAEALLVLGAKGVHVHAQAVQPRHRPPGCGGCGPSTPPHAPALSLAERIGLHVGTTVRPSKHVCRLQCCSAESVIMIIRMRHRA